MNSLKKIIHLSFFLLSFSGLSQIQDQAKINIDLSKTKEKMKPIYALPRPGPSDFMRRGAVPMQTLKLAGLGATQMPSKEALKASGALTQHEMQKRGLLPAPKSRGLAGLEASSGPSTATLIIGGLVVAGAAYWMWKGSSAPKRRKK